jgi:hypothetical protein
MLLNSVVIAFNPLLNGGAQPPALHPTATASLTRYSALFLRRRTMMPRNTAANTAQTIRTMLPSIVVSPFA